MTADDQHQWKQPPPPRPRRRNTLLLSLFDGPIYRDPLAWWTAVWALFSFAAILFAPGPRTSSIPPLLDAFLAMIFFGAVLGILPAAVRLRVRRVMWTRREQRRTAAAVHEPIGDRRPPDSTRTGSATEDTVRIRPVGPPTPIPGADSPPVAGPDRVHQPVMPREPEQPLPSPSAPASTADLRNPPDLPTGPAPAAPPAARMNPARPPTRVSPHPHSANTAVATSEVLREARRLQYPIARTVRALQSARTAIDQHQALIDVTDALCITVGVTGAAWLKATGADPQGLADYVDAYKKGVSQGTWVEIAKRASTAAMAAANPPDGFNSFSQRPARTRLGKLSELTTERNDTAHGARPRNEVQAAERLERLVPVLESVLQGAGYLAAVPWVITTSSSYRARDRTYDVSALWAMGDHPEFEPISRSSSAPVENGRVFLAPDGLELIDLTPFIVYRHCAECSSPELFYSDRLTKAGRVSLKSVGPGHPLTEADLVEEFEHIGPASD